MASNDIRLPPSSGDVAKGIRSLGAQSDPLGRTTRLVEISPGLVLEQVIPLRATEGHGLPLIATDCH